MAMLKCAECGAKISDKAASCPSCGAPRTANQAITKKRIGCGTVVLAVFGAFLAVGITINAVDSYQQGRDEAAAREQVAERFEAKRKEFSTSASLLPCSCDALYAAARRISA